MPLLTTTRYASIQQLCSAVSECISTPFSLDQHRALTKVLDDELDLAVIQDRHQDEVLLRFAKADLTDWICAHLMSTAKAMEARYA